MIRATSGEVEDALLLLPTPFLPAAAVRFFAGILLLALFVDVTFAQDANMMKLVTCDAVSEGAHTYLVLARDAASGPRLFGQMSKEADCRGSNLFKLFYQVR